MTALFLKKRQYTLLTLQPFLRVSKEYLKNKLLWSSSLALATAVFLTACGDELCDGETYDPTKYDCVDNEKQEKKTCKGIQYNPENVFCAMRGSVEIGTYK